MGTNFDTSGIESRTADKVAQAKKWGFIDKSGEFIIAPQYDLVKKFKDGRATVGIGDKYFEIDKSGKKISGDMTRVDVIQKANEKRWASDAAEKQKKAKLPRYEGDIYDASGSKKLGQSNQYQLGVFSEGLATCTEISTKTGHSNGREWDRTGYINEKGCMVIPQQFHKAEDFHAGLAKVERFSRDTDCGYGYIDKSGKLLGGHWYESVGDFSHGLANVYRKPADENRDEKEWGFLSESGEEIFGQWTGVNLFSGKVAAVRDKNGMWGFVNKHGARVSNNLYKNVHYQFDEGLTWVQTDTGYGFVNEQDQPVITTKFAGIDSFSDNLAPAAISLPDPEKMHRLEALQKWRCEFITPSGEKIGNQYFAARHFSEGLAAVRTGLKWGFIDTEGNLAIPAKFDDARSFSNGLAAVLIGDRWGFIDKKGDLKITPRFLLREPDGPRLYPHPFKEGIALAPAPDYFWRFYEQDGKEAFKPPVTVPILFGISDCENFCEGLSIIKNGIIGDFGYIDHQGNFQIPPKLRSATNFSEGFAAISICRERLPVTTVDKYSPAAHSDNPASKAFGFIDKQGNFLGQPKFDQVRSFHEGLAAVAVGQYVWNNDSTQQTVRISAQPPGPALKAKWGFVDRTGKQIIDLQFDEAQDFAEGLAPISVDSKWGYINRSGKIEIATKYDCARSFSDGLALVCIDGRYGFINHDGEFVIPPKYALAGSFSQSRALIINTDSSTDKISASDHFNSKPLQTHSDLLNFLIENASPPDANEWAGND